MSRLGSGGMATVTLAEDTTLGRLVALKRMNAEGDVHGLSRLRREALVGASLSHPNLVPIYDVLAAEDGELIVVMEYVEGETLQAAMRRDSGLSVAAGLRVLDGVSDALDAIHRRGIVHRDVKPANILLGSDGSIKLADLGIASAADRTRITTDGAVLGTFSYMAPEQLGGARSSAPVDVYALAAVAFEVLSGRKAHCEPNPLALAHAISTQPPPDLREAWPQAPRAAAELLVRGMSRDPRERPSSAGELTGRLRATLESHPTAPMPMTADAASAPPPARERAAPPPAPAAPQAPSPPPPPREVKPAAARATSPPPPPREVKPAAARARGSRRGVLAAGLIAVAALAGVLAVVLNGGTSTRGTPSRAAAGHPASTPPGRRPATVKRGTPSSGGTTNATAPTGAAPPADRPSPGTANGSPVAAVKSFYSLAASHQYEPAWTLADPSFRDQLGGYESFKGGQAGERAIIFGPTSAVHQSGTGATVTLHTTSVRTDGTKHCSGTVDLRPGASPGTWLLHQIHIDCT
ncbi:MAG: serine/threonine-protein kinase [Solirubrobacteraceae bacterium]